MTNRDDDQNYFTTLVNPKSGGNMRITADDLARDIYSYIDKAAENDIYITQDGRNIARLIAPDSAKLKAVNDLIGILPVNADIENAREERIRKKSNPQ